MNSTKIFARIAAMLLCLCGSLSYAATHPLNQPMGLAVDAKGNLYVANHGGNQVLVYNPSAQQLTGRTITSRLNGPSQVTFDAQGNLWVSNVSPNSPTYEIIREYGPDGKLNPNGSYIASIKVPAFAVDGMGDLWVAQSDSQDYIQALSPSCVCNQPEILFLQVPGSYTAIAVRGPWIAFGSTTSVSWELASLLINGFSNAQAHGGSGNPGQGVLAMTFDANANLYYATNDGFGVSGIWFVNLATGAAPSLNVNVLYQISGIAVDSVHGRLYLSNASTNKIEIYSTSTGLLMGTIQ